MKDRKRPIKLAAVALLAAVACVVACSQDPGPDSISSRGFTSSAECASCHLSPDRPDLNPLITNGTGGEGKHVVHSGIWGIDCKRCHLDYAALGTHFNGTFDTGDSSVKLVDFDATNPTGRWGNDTGPQTGRCSFLNCHGVNNLEWYGIPGATLPTCIACHSSPLGERRAVTGTEGDFVSNATVASHHVAVVSDPADSQCTVCHDQSQHRLGKVRLNEVDTPPTVIIYNSLDPSSLEPFCLGCHDGNGAGGDMSPFADGETLGVAPFRMSAEIEAHWNRAYGHQRLGLTCVGSGEPGTGCHANGHGSAFAGILAKKLLLPNSGEAPTVANESNYELCYNCHQNYPRVTKEVILGVREGGNYDWDHNWGVNPPYYIANITTTFRDRDHGDPTIPYDDAPWWHSYYNLHYWHLGYGIWSYRGESPSGASCIACHNVHGSDTPWGWVYDALGWTHYNGTGSDEYAQMQFPLNTMKHPVNCTVRCHDPGIQPTSMWFEPPDE